MVSPPPGFERVLFKQFFLCPWCAFRSSRAINEKIGWNLFEAKTLKPRYWCENCNRCSWLRYALPLSFLWGIVSGGMCVMIAFGPIAEFITRDLDSPEWLPMVLAPVVAVLFWPLFSHH